MAHSRFLICWILKSYFETHSDISASVLNDVAGGIYSTLLGKGATLQLPASGKKFEERLSGLIVQDLRRFWELRLSVKPSVSNDLTATKRICKWRNEQIPGRRSGIGVLSWQIEWKATNLSSDTSPDMTPSQKPPSKARWRMWMTTQQLIKHQGRRWSFWIFSRHLRIQQPGICLFCHSDDSQAEGLIIIIIIMKFIFLVGSICHIQYGGWLCLCLQSSFYW